MCKRLFLGIEARIPALYEGAKALEGSLPGRYHPLPNYHVTLAFIGAFETAPVLETLGQEREGLGPLSLETLGEAGFFSKGSRAILYAPVRPHEGLLALARGLREGLKSAGIPVDDREPFLPHVTLARGVKGAGSIPAPLPPVSWTAEEFCLFESRSGEKGVEYIPLEKFKI